jgi:site-specific recombinase XerD
MKGNVKQSPVDWLKNELTEKDYNLAKKTFLQIDESLEGIFLKNIFKEAKIRELDNMDEFSQWLVREKYILNYLNGKLQKPKDGQRPMSELYQIFLKNKEV